MPDNRRQAESLSLSREVCWSRTPQPVGPPQHRPLLHSASGPHTGLDTGATAASAKLTKLQELQDKKQTMDKILQELHSLRDQTLNNNSRMSIFKAFFYFMAFILLKLLMNCVWIHSGRGLSAQYSLSMGGSSEFPSTLTSGASASTSFHPSITQQQDSSNSADKLRCVRKQRHSLKQLNRQVKYHQQVAVQGVGI